MRRRPAGPILHTMDTIGIHGFLERHADRAASTAWVAALAMIEAACQEARERSHSRWRYYPAGELRRLRRDLAAALELARFAVALAEEERTLTETLERDARAERDQAGRQARRAQTLPAELARLANAARRRQTSLPPPHATTESEALKP